MGISGIFWYKNCCGSTVFPQYFFFILQSHVMDTSSSQIHAAQLVFPLPESGPVCSCGSPSCRDPLSLSKQDLVCVSQSFFDVCVFFLMNPIPQSISEVLESTRDAAASRIFEFSRRVEQLGEEGSRLETIIQQKREGML